MLSRCTKKDENFHCKERKEHKGGHISLALCVLCGEYLRFVTFVSRIDTMAQIDSITAAQQAFQDELVGAGLLIPLGVPGVYGRSGVFEGVVEHFERFVTRMGAHLNPEVMRFPPVFARQHYLCLRITWRTFPICMGSIHSFTGRTASTMALLRTERRRVRTGRADLVAADGLMR